MNRHSAREHKNRKDLIGEHRFGDMGQLILFFIFATVWIGDSFFFKYSTFIAAYIPWYIRIPLVIILMFISGYLAQTGLKIVFGEVRPEPVVIDKGVFQIVRHPIYLGAILCYLATVLITLSLVSALVLCIIIIFYHFLARFEERLLIDKFGESYEEYMERVPMWFPKIRKRNKKTIIP
jgi:protein-S-isoprenylcysteine O-methyltransferase Ste14